MASTERFSGSADTAVQTIANSTEQLSANISKLDSISGETLNRVNAISGSFEDHSNVLSTASDLLGKAQSGLADTLDERREALDNLSRGLVERSNEIETTMKSLESIVQDAFTKASERADGAASKLSGSLTASLEDL
ncbi:MAG: hypothetical protein ACWGQW_21550, partial [bacterium]